MTDKLNDVVSSYKDLKEALSTLSGGGNQISGTLNTKAGDSRGVSLNTDSESSRPIYIDGSGSSWLLATKVDIDEILAKL